MPILTSEPEIFPGNLFSGYESEGDWWIAYVRSRREKALARHLLYYEVPYYLPQYEKINRSSNGRERISHLPLFTGYLFFRGTKTDRVTALQSKVIVSILDVPDQALLQSELQDLWALQQSGLPLVPHAYIGPGDPVRIVSGAFKGYRGTVVREKGRSRLIVSVTPFSEQNVVGRRSTTV